MQSSLENNRFFRPARRRTLSIARVFDKKEDILGQARLQEASKAADIIGSSPIPTSPVESTTPSSLAKHTVPRQQILDTPPTSPGSSFPGGRNGQLAAEAKQQRYNRPQTPMDFTFQPKGFGLGISRASIDDVRSQLAEVREELKSMQEKLAERDLEIKSIRTQLDKMQEMYEKAILDAENTAKEKDELMDQVRRLRSAWIDERDARKALEEEIECRIDKERQLQARIRRMSAQDSSSVLARARTPMTDGGESFMGRSRRGTVNGSSLRGSFPFNQSPRKELEL